MPTNDPQERIYTACIIVIGNEILSGRTQDVNISFLAERLGDLGVRVHEARVIRDDEEVIVTTLNYMRPMYDYVFTTGGIGPTHDDITSASIAKAFGVPFERNVEANARLEAFYAPEDRTPERFSMADMPQGVTLIDNPVSKAPGFQIDNVFVLPGVPRIMQEMFEGMVHRITGGDPVVTMSVTSELPEGLFAGPLTAVQERFPDVEIGSYPFFKGRVLGANLVLRSANQVMLHEAVEAVCQMIRDLGSKPLEGGLDAGLTI